MDNNTDTDSDGTDVPFDLATAYTEVAWARARMLLVGGTSYGFFGLYVGNFAIAIWSSYLKEGAKSRIKRRIRWIAWATAVLITIRQILISMGLRDVCQWGDYSVWEGVPGFPVCNDTSKEFARNAYIIEVSALVNLYVPPLVALLSDGVLAWRVYVVWNQPNWLRYVLVATLLMNSAMGLTVAILWTKTVLIDDSYAEGFKNSVSRLYQAWVWVNFVINSTLSMSILFRIWHHADIRHQGLGRYASVLRAIIESALLSWMATVGCAAAWAGSVEPSDPDLDNRFVSSIYAETLSPLLWYSSAIFFALPALLGISQLLIITRVNISMNYAIKDLAMTVTSVTDEQATTEDIPLDSLEERSSHTHVQQTPLSRNLEDT